MNIELVCYILVWKLSYLLWHSQKWKLSFFLLNGYQSLICPKKSTALPVITSYIFLSFSVPVLFCCFCCCCFAFFVCLFVSICILKSRSCSRILAPDSQRGINLHVQHLMFLEVSGWVKICQNDVLCGSVKLNVDVSRIGFWTWIWSTRHWTGAGSGLLVSMLEIAKFVRPV